MFPAPPRTPVLKPWNAPFLGSPVLFRRFLEKRIQISRGKSPTENITWFRYGEIRSTTNLDSSPHAPQKKTVRIDRIIQGARREETRRGALGNACSLVLIPGTSVSIHSWRSVGKQMPNRTDHR